MKGGTKPRSNGQREHACRLPVTCTVLALGHGHGVSVVDESKPATVKALKTRSDVVANPSLAQVGGSDRPSILDGSGKTHADGAMPADGLQRRSNGRKHDLRFG